MLKSQAELMPIRLEPSDERSSPRVGILFSSCAYHVDRCAAAAARLDGRATVLAVNGAVLGLVRVGAFGGGAGPRSACCSATSLTRQSDAGGASRGFRGLHGCDTVFVASAITNRDDAVALPAPDRRRVMVMSESKFDTLAAYAARRVQGAVARSVFGSLGRRQAPRRLHALLGFRQRPWSPAMTRSPGAGA